MVVSAQRRLGWPRARRLGQRRADGNPSGALAPFAATQGDPTQFRGILGPVILREVHIEIGGTPGLVVVETQGSGATCCGDMAENFTGSSMHRMSSQEGPGPGTSLFVTGVGVDFLGDPPENQSHGSHVGYGLPEGSDR